MSECVRRNEEKRRAKCEQRLREKCRETYKIVRKSGERESAKPQKPIVMYFFSN